MKADKVDRYFATEDPSTSLEIFKDVCHSLEINPT